MSHIASYKTDLKNVDLALLVEAFKTVAAAHQGEIGTTVKDMYGNKREVPIALICAIIPYGIGADVVEGILQFIGESYGVTEWTNVSQEIQNAYTALATAQVLRELGYDITNVNTDAQGTLALEAVGQ